jgi:hypothetical protein
MNFLIYIPSVFIFFFTLYKLVKDDHVFLRKNIKIEQFFDVGFIVFFTSWIIARIVMPSGVFSLTYVVAGGIVILYLLGRRKRLPIGRLFDFFTVSFLAAIPLMYVMFGVLTDNLERVINFSYAAFYFILLMFFLKGILPRLMNRTVKEGALSIFFLFLFSIASLLVHIFNVIRGREKILSAENIVLILFLLIGFVLLFKQKK